MKQVVIIGAGASGRGHMGQLARESGYELIFLDKDKTLVETLRKAGSYKVRLVAAKTIDTDIAGFNIFHTGERDAFQKAFNQAPLIFTAVCPNNLKDVADYLRPMLVDWLEASGKHDFKNIMCCENMNNSSSVLKNHILQRFPEGLKAKLETQVGFPDTMIARVVAKPRDPLQLLGEAYSEWTADKAAFRGLELPKIRTLDLVDDQEKFLRRKLYIHNTGHATFGYLGFIKGYTFIHEAARDPAIMQIVEKAIEESGWGVGQEYGFSEENIRAYRQALTDKCVNDALPDDLTRVVREPIRKLGPDERFFGPIGLMLKHGRDPDYLLRGLCAAIIAEIPGDQESVRLRELVVGKGIKGLLAELNVKMPDRIVSKIEELSAAMEATYGKRGGTCAAK
ncbi:MAG: hypothetical protein NT011_02115 [Kiritimatiellaeota bacterium]|nr:hypothetical protein [Kiritimatiellota bacterium]